MLTPFTSCLYIIVIEILKMKRIAVELELGFEDRVEVK